MGLAMIEKLEKLLAEASDRPWKYISYINDGWGEIVKPRVGTKCWDGISTGKVHRTNAELIVALRNLAPELLAVVRAADPARIETPELYEALDALEAKLKEVGL